MRCFAFTYDGYEVELDTIARTEDSVRLLVLKSCMGWRFDHPERYDQDEAWNHLQSHGRIVQVEITVVPTPPQETTDAD